MLMRILLTFLLAITTINLCEAQTKVSGKVLTEHGEIIAFAQIIVPKTRIGTAADEKGQFSFTVPKGNSQLLVSALGYESKTIKFDSSNAKNLFIVLQTTARMLDEVVVTTGYVKKRSDIAGSSVSKILTSELESVKVKSADDGRPKNLLDKKGKSSIGENHVVPAKLLTASELNDFTKWTLWNNYNLNDFAAFSKNYKISQTKRISIQLLNLQKQPLVAQKISLVLAHNKEIVWDAKTDNTGKAEMWVDSILHDAHAQYQALVNNKYFDVHFFDQGVNVIAIDNTCNINDAVDIAFIVDATGSMGDEIAYLKTEVTDIVGQVKKLHPNTEFKFASVFYRDFNDAYLTRHSNFSADVNDLNDFINLQHAGGGGDYPEAVNSALQTALDSITWNEKAKAKLAFLILDAPPHDHEIKEYKMLMQQYAAQGIRVIPVVCSGAQKNVEFLMRSIALATNGTYAFLTDDSGIGEKHMKPTTDNFTVTTLNQLMVKIINGMIYTPPCSIDPQKPVLQNPFTQNTPEVGKDKVYPNPTSGPCSLKTEDAIIAMYLADFNGKILQKINPAFAKRNKIAIDLTPYAAGTYLVVYQNEKGETRMQKVIKL